MKINYLILSLILMASKSFGLSLEFDVRDLEDVAFELKAEGQPVDKLLNIIDQAKELKSGEVAPYAELGIGLSLVSDKSGRVQEIDQVLLTNEIQLTREKEGKEYNNIVSIKDPAGRDYHNGFEGVKEPPGVNFNNDLRLIRDTTGRQNFNVSGTREYTGSQDGEIEIQLTREKEGREYNNVVSIRDPSGRLLPNKYKGIKDPAGRDYNSRIAGTKEPPGRNYDNSVVGTKEPPGRRDHFSAIKDPAGFYGEGMDLVIADTKGVQSMDLTFNPQTGKYEVPERSFAKELVLKLMSSSELVNPNDVQLGRRVVPAQSKRINLKRSCLNIFN